MIRYATSKLNTRFTFLRLGETSDDTFKVTVYRDGVAESFTTNGDRAAEYLTFLADEGFETRTVLPNVLFEAWYNPAGTCRTCGRPCGALTTPNPCC